MQKRDVLAFAAHAEDCVFDLYAVLRDGTYMHGPYSQFIVHDPKRRQISCASVRDRVVHQAIVQVIEPLFERRFIAHSFASRAGKGTHAMVECVARFLRQASANNRRTVWVLQCDIRKFFDGIPHDVLLNVLGHAIHDQRLMELLSIIVRSVRGDCGLPLGNVTSQLFGNAYLDAFDHFVKEYLRIRWYARFCDDMLIIHQDRAVLERVLPLIREWLYDQRGLALHPKKVTIRKFSYGIDCVGQVLRPYCHTLRRVTARRALRTMRMYGVQYRNGTMVDDRFRSAMQSFYGCCAHGSNAGVRQRMHETIWETLWGAEALYADQS